METNWERPGGAVDHCPVSHVGDKTQKILIIDIDILLSPQKTFSFLSSVLSERKHGLSLRNSRTFMHACSYYTPTRAQIVSPDLPITTGFSKPFSTFMATLKKRRTKKTLILSRSIRGEKSRSHQCSSCRGFPVYSCTKNCVSQFSVREMWTVQTVAAPLWEKHHHVQKELFQAIPNVLRHQDS